MAISRKSFFPWYPRLLAVIPWPVSASLITAHLVALPLSRLNIFLSYFALIPREVFDGRVWEIWTGQLVQPTTPMMTAIAAVTIGLFGRELEERVGSLRFLLIYLRFCAVTSILWIVVQYVADSLDLFAGLSTPLTSYPAVTAIVACRLAQSPWSRIGSQRFSLPTWLASLLYLIVLLTLLILTEPWPIVLPAQLIAIAVGLFTGWLFERRLNQIVRSFTPPPSIPRPIVASAIPLDNTPRGMSDEELDRRLDELLAEIAQHGQDSLSAEDRLLLDEASRRRRDRPR